MALIACPECDRKVSELADTCPNCGHTLKIDPAMANASHVTALKVTIGFALLAGLGSFLPWATVRHDSGGPISFRGMDGDGAVTLILGGFMIVIALLALRRGWAGAGQIWLLFLCAFGIAVIGIYDLINISSIVGQTESGATTASVGIGLYLVTVAGIALVIVGIWVLRTRPEPAKAKTGSDGS